MRPVPTWKSTDAAPTPISEGAIEPPSAFRPWQEEQPKANIRFPSSIKVDFTVVSILFVLGSALATWKVAPSEINATVNSAGPAKRWRR